MAIETSQINRLHIGIIPDGNRRFAREKRVDLGQGYLDSMNTMNQIIRSVGDIKQKDPILGQIGMITVYVCSRDNLTKRSSTEINKIYDLVRSYFKQYQDEKSIIHQCQIKVNCVGNLELLPEDIQKLALELNDSTKNYNYNDSYTLNLALGYDGRAEILDAVNKLLNDHKNKNKNLNEEIKIKPEDLTNSLYVTRDIDLVIRTGREKRSSSFFPWITTYSEWFYLDKYWPEFTVDDLKSIIVDFSQRNRRYGQ